MALTDTEIRAAKPKERPYRLFDGGGLYLEVSPKGGKLWRLKYRYEGKEKRLAFGVYPEVPLAGRKDNANNTWIEGARERREAARQLLASGIDPGAQKKALKATKLDKAANSFEFVTQEWLEKFKSQWKTTSADRKLAIFQRDVFPKLGNKPVADITAADVLDVLRNIEKRGASETAARARMYCGQAFRYAVATGRANRDPTADLRGALAPSAVTHRAALTDPAAIGGLLRAIDDYSGYFVTQCALKLAPLVFVRPGELRNAEWAEIDLKKAEWNIPPTRMKMKQPHLVPLSKQAVAILSSLHRVTGKGRYVFPSARDPKRPMSDNAVLASLRRMGFAKDEMSGHGFRAMARTVMDEVLGIRPDYIEHQLAHAVRDPLGRAYNRTSHLPERRAMMQQWADYLDQLKADKNDLPSEFPLIEDDEAFARESFNEMVQGELASIDAILDGTIQNPDLRQQIIDHKNLLLSGISHLREALEGDLTSEQITGIYSAVVVVTGSIRLLSDQTFIYSGAAERFSEQVKALKARVAKLDKAQVRLELLRSALREQAETVPLVDSAKYADSIRDDLMKRLALNNADSWPSISVIRRGIRSVLSDQNKT